MAFIIKLKDSSQTDKVYKAILKELSKSRFTSEVSNNQNKIQFSQVRLRESKGYCGNHSGPCRLTGQKHHKMKFLEGADWVGFNDMLNDILDKLSIEANVASSHCVIRKGFERRYRYTGVDGGEWNKDEPCYLNNCGKGPLLSTFPIGTPGLAVYRQSSVARYVRDCVKAGKEPYLD